MSQNDKKGYKDTLNLPQTSFDMKANLLKKEPAIQQQWAKQNLYGLIRKQHKGTSGTFFMMARPTLMGISTWAPP